MTIENAARWFRFTVLPYLVKADIACAECGRPYWVAEGQSLEDGWRCDRCVSAAPKSQRTSKPIAVSDILFGALIGGAMLGVVIIIANITIVPQPCRSPYPDQCDVPGIAEWAVFIGFVAFVVVGLAAHSGRYARVEQTMKWWHRSLILFLYALGGWLVLFSSTAPCSVGAPVLAWVLGIGHGIIIAYLF